MVRTRSASLWRVALLVGLLSVVQFESSHASVSILWRYAVLSWDNPATQIQDELACGTAPCADLAGEARESVRAVHLAPGVLAPSRNQTARESPAHSAGITRSPPAS